MAHTTVHLMRHGEVHNPHGVLYGRLPGYVLSERGHAMAAGVAQRLESHDIRAVIASPLERAQQTATPTAQHFGLDLLTDESLIEAGNLFEGEAITNPLVLAHPRYWRRYVNPTTPSWGEPYTQIVARMSSAVRSALELLPEGGEALLVSHQLPIWVTRLWLERRPLAHDPRRRQCSLASLTSLSFEDRKLVGISYSEPVADLVAGAADMVPGRSGAVLPGREQETHP